MMATRALRGLLSQTVRTSLNVNKNNAAAKQAVGGAARHFATTTAPKAQAQAPKAEPAKVNTPPPAQASSEGEEYTGYKLPTKYVTESTQNIVTSSRAGQFAAALYEMIGTKVDDVDQEFTFMEQLFEGQPEILEEFSADIRSEADRLKLVKNLSAVTPMSDCTVSFFEFLARLNVLYAIPEIISEYHAIIDKARKIAEVRLYVAHPADAIEFQNYSAEKRNGLYKQLGLPADTKDVNITYFYDPSLIQGTILRTATEEIDMSMATQIKKVDEALEAHRDKVFQNTVKQFRAVEEDPSAQQFDFSLSPQGRKDFIDNYFAKSVK